MITFWINANNDFQYDMDVQSINLGISNPNNKKDYQSIGVWLLIDKDTKKEDVESVLHGRKFDSIEIVGTIPSSDDFQVITVQLKLDKGIVEIKTPILYDMRKIEKWLELLVV